MNSKVHVKIGRKYEDAFKAICKLVSNGCIDRSVIQSCTDDQTIETEQYVFEYTGEVETIDTGAEIGMTPSGSSWFIGFRGGESNNVMGIWYDLLELVASNYHKEYSLVEYVQNTVSRSDAEIENYKKTIRNVVEGLKIPISKIALAPQDESTEDIYACSVRLEVFIGVGEPTPLLCKVYFRKRGKSFSPLSTSEAAAVDEYISTLVSKNAGSDALDKSSTETEIVDNVLNSVSKLIAGELSQSFTESVLITNEIDTETLNALLANETQDEVRLQCKKLKVLGISHIRWIDTAFNVFVESRKAFLVKFGLNGTVNLYCCCGAKDNKLVENNVIVCTSPDTGATTKITLKTDREDLGLNSEQLEMIQHNSIFADHLFQISCSELVRRNVDCVRYRCRCNTVAFEVDGKLRYKCADCPYPEVVYRHTDGTPAYTPLLNFDTATLSVVDEETETCRVCGRSYARSALNSTFVCKFCASAYEAVETKTVEEKHKRAYRKYAQMLPLTVRLGALFAPKYCFENADRLLFFVGNKKYFFDKLKLNDTGMISQPEKRQ